MTGQLHVRVAAKVNLSLRVGPTRSDGYHELATVFQALSLFDDLTARNAPAGELSLSFRGEGAGFLPTDETNLAIRAAKAMMERFERPDVGVELHIDKHIPVAGGMAGGSADAAAVLVACNELWQCGATPQELAKIGAGLGADVPFSLLGGTAVGTARGDRVTPIAAAGTYYWTLALAPYGLSTPAVFNHFDSLVPEPNHPQLEPELLHALESGDLDGVAAGLTNDLEPAVVELQPELGQTLACGRQAGALGAVISGSGPTCAFLSSTMRDAQRVADALSAVNGVKAVRTASGPVPGAVVVR